MRWPRAIRYVAAALCLSGCALLGPPPKFPPVPADTLAAATSQLTLVQASKALRACAKAYALTYWTPALTGSELAEAAINACAVSARRVHAAALREASAGLRSHSSGLSPSQQELDALKLADTLTDTVVASARADVLQVIAESLTAPSKRALPAASTDL